MTIDESALRALPKVVLHDHLDGGVRPATLVELAADVGHELPTTDPTELGAWFVRAASSGSLPLYLETFDHTVAVMQTADHLRRVARESALDLAADGVVYAEQRYAPEQHLAGGLSLQEVVDAVQSGFAEGIALAAEEGRTIRIGTLVTAMRHADRGDEIAALALANRDAGVVGFDIAGAEDGLPAVAARVRVPHAARRELPDHRARRRGCGAGLASRRRCTSRARSGSATASASPTTSRCGSPRTADSGRRRSAGSRTGCATSRCRSSCARAPTSRPAAASSIADHPITMLRDLGFAVTVNTDNRLQSGTTLTREMHLLVTEAGWTLDDLRDATLTAAWSAFLHHDEREALVEDVLAPAWSRNGSGRHRA